MVTEDEAKYWCRQCGVDFVTAESASDHQGKWGHTLEVMTQLDAGKLTAPSGWLSGDDMLDGYRNRNEERSMRKIAWTVTGNGVPMGSRAKTWEALGDIVERAEKLGLRVEFAELTEEEL